MPVLLLSLALASWRLPDGVDPEATALVERIVEQRDGLALAEGRVASLLESLGYDPPRAVPGPTARSLRWLPTLVLRFSWSPGRGHSTGRREVIVCLSWPLG